MISLALEGRDTPRRPRGRPRKPKPVELSLELMLEESNDVDPEQALEKMFKEAEENRLSSRDDNSRRRRRIRIPQR